MAPRNSYDHFRINDCIKFNQYKTEVAVNDLIQCVVLNDIFSV